MRTIKVHFSDGNSLVTAINGTRDEIEKYYLGKYFNLGDGEKDKMEKAIRIEFLN